MPFTVTDLRAIASSGGGMLLDARGFTVTELRAIATSAKDGGAQLTLRNVAGFTVTDLRAIAISGGGKVIFDFLP